MWAIVQTCGWVGLGAAATLLGSCANPDSAVGFTESSPNARIRAIRQAAAEGDKASVGPLIGLLESDDPAERLLAIRTLERVTGQTHGYDHAAGREERREAVRRWADWYAQQGAAAPAKGA